MPIGFSGAERKMNFEIHTDRNFSFERKPSPVPGDLRIGWRIPLTLLMLNHSRGKRASLAKLNLLNDALRSERSRGKLSKIIRGDGRPLSSVLHRRPAYRPMGQKPPLGRSRNNQIHFCNPNVTQSQKRVLTISQISDQGIVI